MNDDREPAGPEADGLAGRGSQDLVSFRKTVEAPAADPARTLEGLHRQIEEHRRIEHALRARARALVKSEQRYRGLFESSRDAIMLLEPPDWLFTSVNPAMVQMFRARNVEHFLSATPWDVSPKRSNDTSRRGRRGGHSTR